jgi:polyferredoxin
VKEDYEREITRRRGVQIVMAVAFLGIVIGGWRYPLLGYFIPLCMLLGVGLAVVRGRKWCDWACPRAGFLDGVVRPLSPERRIPRIFKSTGLRIIVMAILMGIMISQLIRLWPDPYKMGGFFVLMLSVTTVIGIMFGLFMHQRVWCCICPIGSMSNWVGKKKYPLTLASDLCVECGVCHDVCRIQINPGSFKTAGSDAMVADGDCLKCGLCVAACPKKALSLGPSCKIDP